MPDNLPVELVELVIDHVNHAPTLLNCLILSRILTSYVERALYTDARFVITQAPELSLAPSNNEPNQGWKNSPNSGAHASFRAALESPTRPRLRSLTTHFTVRILFPLRLISHFYIDLNEVLPKFTNLKYLDMR